MNRKDSLAEATITGHGVNGDQIWLPRTLNNPSSRWPDQEPLVRPLDGWQNRRVRGVSALNAGA